MFTMCVHGAGKFDPRALAVGLIEVFILGQGTVPCPIRDGKIGQGWGEKGHKKRKKQKARRGE